jgi:hypothetical protein
MDTSIFMDLSKIPEITDLAFPLSKTYPIWKEIRDFVIEKYPAAIEEWHVAVKKYGWGFRIKDKKACNYLFVTTGRIFSGGDGIWPKGNRSDFKF